MKKHSIFVFMSNEELVKLIEEASKVPELKNVVKQFEVYLPGGLDI